VNEQPPLVSASDISWGTLSEQHEFRRLGEGAYRLNVAEHATTFEVTHLGRNRDELRGHLVVTCDIKGARTFDGHLSSGTFVLSDIRARGDLAKRLRDRASTKNDVDWDGLLEEFITRVLKAERAGQPVRLLHTLERPQPDDVFDLEGLVLPKRHPSILFGDGGTFKSYMGLYVAGYLGQVGRRVLYADWELEGEDHRLRLERLFGADMPPVYYQRCYRPLIHEVETLQRHVIEQRIDYVICDSIGVATDGPPEAAEAATKYFRAVRQLGAGSLHLAHVTKPKDDGVDPTKPFGSVYWSNLARMTWFVKRTEGADDSRIAVALFNKKANLNAVRPAVGLEIQFDDERTLIRRVDVADVDELARSLPVWQRMRRALVSGPRTLANLADEFGADDEGRQRLIDTMAREVRRKKNVFTTISNTADGVHRIALVSRREPA
jgi:hypothetical protein